MRERLLDWGDSVVSPRNLYDQKDLVTGDLKSEAAYSLITWVVLRLSLTDKIVTVDAMKRIRSDQGPMRPGHLQAFSRQNRKVGARGV